MSIVELVEAIGVSSAFRMSKAKAIRLGVRLRVELQDCLVNEEDVRRTIRIFVDGEDLPHFPLTPQQRMELLKAAHTQAGVSEA